MHPIPFCSSLFSIYPKWRILLNKRSQSNGAWGIHYREEWEGDCSFSKRGKNRSKLELRGKLVGLSCSLEAPPSSELCVGWEVWECGLEGAEDGEPFSLDPAGLAGTTVVSEWDPGSKATPSRVCSWKTREKDSDDSPKAWAKPGTQPSPLTQPGC